MSNPTTPSAPEQWDCELCKTSWNLIGKLCINHENETSPDSRQYPKIVPTLSRRDEFAKAAMMGDLASQDTDDGHYSNSASLEQLAPRAKLWVRFADALIAELDATFRPTDAK